MQSFREIWVNVSLDSHDVGLDNADGCFYNQGTNVTKRMQTGIKIGPFHRWHVHMKP